MKIFTTNLVFAISFAIFLYIAYIPIKKAILDFLNKEIEKIKSNYYESVKLKDEAKALLDETKKEIKEFESKKEKILSDAKENIEKLILDKKTNLQKIIEYKKQSAKQELEKHQKHLNLELQKQFIEKSFKLVEDYFNQESEIDLSDAEFVKKYYKA